MKITFMRHGETDWNRERRIQGIQDVSLNEKGIRQTELTCRHFLATCASFTLIVSSPLLRARQTAEICSRMLSIPQIVLPHFRERTFGLFEGKTMDEIAVRHGITDVESLEGPDFGVEEISELRNRVLSGINHLQFRFKDERILLVTHGSIIKWLLEHYGAENGQHGGIIYNAGFVQIDVTCMK